MWRSWSTFGWSFPRFVLAPPCSFLSAQPKFIELYTIHPGCSTLSTIKVSVCLALGQYYSIDESITSRSISVRTQSKIPVNYTRGLLFFCGIFPFIGSILHTPTPIGRSRMAYWASREPKHLRLMMSCPVGGDIDGSLLAIHYHAMILYARSDSHHNVPELPTIFQDRRTRLTVV